MERLNVIVLLKSGQIDTKEDVETHGSLTDLCDKHGFSYNYLKKKKFPFEYKGLKFIKTKYKAKTIEND